MKKAIIGMSGGVDSAAAAYLTKQLNVDISGATILTGNFSCHTSQDTNTESYITEARALASFFDIEHTVVDFSELFKKHVISNFIDSYLAGLTPNPCIECNRHIKFGALLDYAIQNGADTLVTGHYADIKKIGQRYHLCRARDESKDQSYVLWQLKQHQLSHIYFPLARYLKSEIYELAKTIGFINPHNKESQDICFIPNGDYASFIQRESGISSNPGNFIDTHGNIIGKHKGIIHYTIGQRKGLGLSLGEPGFVSAKDAITNTVTVCRGPELFKNKLTAHSINLIACDSIPERTAVTAKIRYNQKAEPAYVIQSDTDEITVEFNSPQRAISPGQSVVLYDGDTVIGGGIIS